LHNSFDTNINGDFPSDL